MKQHIDLQQLQSLNPKAQERLRKWWKPQTGDKVFSKKFDLEVFLDESGEGWITDITDKSFNHNDFLPLLSIGQCIEFLRENIKNTVIEAEGDEPYRIEEGELYPLSGINFSKDNYDEKKGITAKHPEYKHWSFFIDDDLTVDSLWQAVKEVLEAE